MAKFILDDVLMFPATFELIDDTESELSVSLPQKNVAYIFCLVVFLRHKAMPPQKKQKKAPKNVIRWRKRERPKYSFFSKKRMIYVS